MKKTRKLICFLTAFVMVCTMTSVSVFAAANDETGIPEENGAQAMEDMDLENPEEYYEEADDNVAPANSDDAAMEDEGSFTKNDIDPGEEEQPPARQLAKPSVTALSGYKAIKLTWKAVPGAEAYNVGYYNKSKKKWAWVGTTRALSIEKAGLKYRTKHKFRVMAVKIKEESKAKTNLSYTDIEGYQAGQKSWAPPTSPATYVTKQTVNRLRISFTMKKTKKANGKKLKKGKRVWAENFGLGKYTVYRGGKRLRVPRIMVKNIKASYVKKGNYGDAQARFFIQKYMKDKKLKSGTKYVIWVSSYTQHLYVFDKTENYKVVKDHRICMGKKTTPSPSGNKKITKRIKNRHGIKYWSCYSGLNALHGFKGSWSKKILGKLASGGCVRNWTSDAKWIWDHCGKGTRVIVY